MEQDIGFYRDSKSATTVPREVQATAGEPAGDLNYLLNRKEVVKDPKLNSVHLADVSCFGPL